jgi:hypothetical protein
VILFQDVIKILNRSVLTVLLQKTLGFELDDGWWISSALVEVGWPDQERSPEVFRSSLICSQSESYGFREHGPDGLALEQAISFRRGDMRVIGPNSLGG